MKSPFYFQNTTPEEHRAYGRAKVERLKYEAQGTSGFLWVMCLFVFIAYMCRNDLPALPQVDVGSQPIREEVAYHPTVYRPDPHRPAGTLDLLVEWFQ